MDIYVLNQSLDRIGTVDVYESFSWITPYNGVGSFELHCPISLFSLLKEEMIIQNSEDDKHSGIIEYIQKAENEDGSEKLVIKGRMTEVYLDRRVALGSYTYESMQPAQITADLITKNAILPDDPARKIDMLEIGELANADQGTVSYAGANEKLPDIPKKLCAAAQLGYRLYADDENKKLVFDVYKGVNRTEEDNTSTSIETHTAINVLNYGHFENYLTGWSQIDGGTNYLGQQILYAAENPRIFNKVKLKDRYAEYWETTGNFKQWVYFYRKAGHILEAVNLNKDHMYYIDIKCNNPTDAVLGYGIVSGEDYTFNVSKTSNFERFNAVYVPKTNGAYTFTLAYGDISDIEGLTVETEYGGMIDLTETFGVGKEPDMDWCKDNLYYEAGVWKYKVEIISFIPNSNDPLVLSRDRDTLVEVEYFKSITNECTIIYVHGDGLDTTVSNGITSGIMRKERYLDLSSIKRVRDGATIPEASYISMLQTNAKATLRQLTVNELIDGKLYLLSNKKFGRDFYLGDIVMCSDNSIGFSVNLRISSATQVWDTNGYQITVTLGDDVPDIYETMKLVSKGAK